MARCGKTRISRADSASKTRVNALVARRRRAGALIRATVSGNLQPEACRHSCAEIRLSTRRPGHLVVGPGPGAPVGHQRTKHGMVELVTSADRSVGCKKRSARQSKVTNGIEYLMTHEFIRETD